MTEEFMFDVVQRLTRIETKLDNTSDHEGRLRSLENGRSKWSGITAAASVLLSVIVSFVTKHFVK